MVDERTVKFFEGVLSKTKAGKIPWEPTALEARFIAPIGGEFSLSISAVVEPVSLRDAALRVTIKGGFDRYTLVLRDLHGKVLTTVTENDEGVRPDAMRELYETARREAIRPDEKINKAIEVLQTL
ncbi:MAG: hypothetical protein ABSH24_07835 [Bryobacteraceae bacterium]|jgi:hypothetical protein